MPLCLKTNIHTSTHFILFPIRPSRLQVPIWSNTGSDSWGDSKLEGNENWGFGKMTNWPFDCGILCYCVHRDFDVSVCSHSCDLWEMLSGALLILISLKKKLSGLLVVTFLALNVLNVFNILINFLNKYFTALCICTGHRVRCYETTKMKKTQLCLHGGHMNFWSMSNLSFCYYFPPQYMCARAHRGLQGVESQQVQVRGETVSGWGAAWGEGTEKSSVFRESTWPSLAGV